MNQDCRWILYGLMSGGLLNNFNLSSLMSKRASLITTTLRYFFFFLNKNILIYLIRNRSDAFKADLIQKFKEFLLPRFAENKFRVIVDRKIEINWESDAEKLVRILFYCN